MSNNLPSIGGASLLAAIAPFLGGDKFYTGHIALGIIQILLIFTIVGIPISYIWGLISALVLIFAAIRGSSMSPPFYPKTRFAPFKKSDSTLAWISLFLIIFTFVFSMIWTKNNGKKQIENFRSKLQSRKEDPNDCFLNCIRDDKGEDCRAKCNMDDTKEGYELGEYNGHYANEYGTWDKCRFMNYRTPYDKKLGEMYNSISEKPYSMNIIPDPSVQLVMNSNNMRENYTYCMNCTPKCGK